jgi:hypothetical protein
MADEERTGPDEIDAHFFRLVATFEAAAMQQLGKIASPLTGEVEVSLEGARDSIDMLDMMRRKCDGNLSPNEERLLSHVLYQLRMNYVEVSKEGGAPAGGSETARPEAGSASDAPSKVGDSSRDDAAPRVPPGDGAPDQDQTP